MPEGLRGEKRPADAVGRSVHIAKIATGEIDDEREALSSAAAKLGRKGGKARAISVPKERRIEIAKSAATARWSKARHPQD